MTLREYRTHIGAQLLTRLAGKPSQLGRQSLNNIRSLASAIFTHAVNTGVVESSPWHDAKVLGKVKQPVGTVHHTLTHTIQMIAALRGYPQEQAIIALACFLGMRPGEIQDFNGQISLQMDGFTYGALLRFGAGISSLSIEQGQSENQDQQRANVGKAGFSASSFLQLLISGA